MSPSACLWLSRLGNNRNAGPRNKDREGSHRAKRVAGGDASLRIDSIEISGLDSLLEPLSLCLDAESARRALLPSVLTQPVQARIEKLAEQAMKAA